MERPLLSDSFFLEELREQMWKASNKLVWGSIFFLILISILDFLLIKDQYLVFIFLNFSGLILIALCNFVLSKILKKPTPLLHLVSVILLFLFLYSIGISDKIGYYIYLPLIAVTFVSFNSIAIWSTANSVVQFITLCLLIIVMDYFGIVDFDLIIQFGGYTVLVVAAVSITFPSIKLLSLKDDIKETYLLKSKEKELSIANNQLTSNLEKNTAIIQKHENVVKVFKHDLKNKLGGIESLIDLIELENQYVVKPEEHNYLDMIKNSLADVSSETGFFKHFDKANVEEEAILDKSMVNLHDLINDNKYKFFEKTSSQNIKLYTELKAKNSMIYVDKNIANTAIYNLIKYAISFSKNNDSISIITRNYDQFIILEIANRNTGITMAQLESYFKNINEYQIIEKRENQGLGLSIAKSNIELLDGHLRYSAANTLGFEFLVEFTYTS